MTARSRPRSHRSSGKASFVVVAGGALLSGLLVFVAVKFLGDRAGTKAIDRPAADLGFSAAGQAAEERRVEASRRKYRRQLRFCEALGRFEGADLSCLGDFAAEHGDLFFCGEVPAASRADCVRRIAAAGRGELCDQVPPSVFQLNCYLDAAAASGDAAPCEKMPDRPEQRACVAIARSDVAGCEALREKALRTACFHRVAVRTRNPVLCEGVRDPQMPEGFQHELFDCWRDAAVATGRVEDCARIPHEGVHASTAGSNAYHGCVEKVKLRRAGANCREGPVDLTCRGKMAAAKDDFTLCRNLRSDTEMDLCALTFGFRKNDPSACSVIREERLRTACVEITGGPAAP